MTQTIVEFTRLSRIEVGGTKGKSLTTSVHQVFQDFMAAVAVVKNVRYDILDVDATKFDDDFYIFRQEIKVRPRASELVPVHVCVGAPIVAVHLVVSCDDLARRSRNSNAALGR